MLRKLAVVVAVAALVALVGTSISNAQEATPEEVEAAFIDLTRAEIESRGYVIDEECISAETVGAPAALGAMGFHAINEALIDTTLDPLEPEIILLDAEDNVIAVEYATPPQDEPLTVLGQQLAFVDGPDIDALHLWFLENPAGPFAAFNTNTSCPAVAEAEEEQALPATGVSGSTSGNSAVLIVLALLGLAGLGMGTAGWKLRRSASR